MAHPFQLDEKLLLLLININRYFSWESRTYDLASWYIIPFKWKQISSDYVRCINELFLSDESVCVIEKLKNTTLSLNLIFHTTNVSLNNDACEKKNYLSLIPFDKLLLPAV